MNTLSARLLPMIAVPTTAGTGSEVSAVAMIKDHQDKKKLMFGSRFLFPDVAILDPKLLLSLPPKLTAATGLDALTHAIESYTATTKNSPSDALCLEAMRLIFSNLPKATTQGSDIEARSATLVGSMLAGVSFTNAGVGIVHALAHSLGGTYGTHHGMTNAVFLPYGMEFNLDQVADKFAAAYVFLVTSGLGNVPAPVGPWFSMDEQPTRIEAQVAGRKLIHAVRELTAYCRLPSRLKDLGLPELSDQDLHQIAETAMNDPAMMFNPKHATMEEVIGIIKRAY
jgi:alcohol dehydrogenase class IV